MNNREKTENNINLDSFLQIGDIVIVNNGNNEGYPIENALPDGTELRVMGFTQWLDYRDFGWITEEKPRGIYQRFGAAIYQLADSQSDRKYFTYSAHHLKFKDETIDPQKTRRDTFNWKMEHGGVRIGDLPSRGFEPDDKVRFIGTRYGSDTRVAYGVIERVEYSFLRDNDETRYSVALYYHHSELKGRREDDTAEFLPCGSYPFVRESELELIERGNFHAHLNGGELKFDTIQEEVSFYTMLGHGEQLRSPVSGDYSWTLEEALISIRNGTGSVVRMSGGMFGSSSFPTVYDYPTLPELSERLRAETLKGFADTYVKIDAGETLT